MNDKVIINMDYQSLYMSISGSPIGSTNYYDNNVQLTLSTEQREFLEKVKTMIYTNWYKRKYRKTAYKDKTSQSIVVLTHSDVLDIINNRLNRGSYTTDDRPLLKKIRQHYKKFKRHTKLERDRDLQILKNAVDDIKIR